MQREPLPGLMKISLRYLFVSGLLLALLGATDAAYAIRADECEQQRALYPENWNDVSKATALFRCQSHYAGALLVSIGTPDAKGQSVMNLVPIESGDGSKPKIDAEHPVHRIWLDADQTRRLKEGKYFATVVRKADSCWIRGDLSDDPIFFMDNADPQADSSDAGAFYNKAPRISSFKGESYSCEPIK